MNRGWQLSRLRQSRARQPAEANADDIRSAVESLERSVRGIDGRVASIERDRPQRATNAPPVDLFDLRRSVDQLTAKVKDLDYRVRRLEIVHRF